MHSYALIAAGGAACAVAYGCIDLFHSTDFANQCGESPSACTDAQDTSRADGAADARDDASETATSFCAWGADTAHENARRACAWLGACWGPLGNNAFGDCFDHALLAYDCALNPNRPVIGRTFAFWDCLWRAQSCSDVTRCVLPDGPPTCATSGAEYGACASQAQNENAAVRIDCLGSGTLTAAENCVAVGQTCSMGVCGGTSGPCDETRCEGTHLRDCVDGGTAVVDMGVDCANFGAGTCAGEGGLPACVASGDACAPTPAVTCSFDGHAIGCPSGVVEDIDCRSLMEDAGACASDAPGRPWDVARACVPNDDAGCMEACLSGGIMQACHRGKAVLVDCAKYGLPGGCTNVAPMLVPHVACVKP
jgi:hypothetical protein